MVESNGQRSALAVHTMKITYISRVAVPVEVQDGESAGAASAQRPLRELVVSQVGLIRLYQGLWPLVFALFESLRDAVDDFDDLLVGSLPVGRAQLLDVLIPICVRKRHLILHALLELIALLPTALEYAAGYLELKG